MKTSVRSNYGSSQIRLPEIIVWVISLLVFVSIIYGFNLRAQETELFRQDTIWLKTGEVIPCAVDRNNSEVSTVSAKYIGTDAIITFRQFSKYEIDQIKFGDEIIYNKKPGKPGLKKNAIYVSAGTFGAPYRFINGSFERMLWGNKHRVIQSIFIRVCFGTESYAGLITGIFFTSDVKAINYLSTIGALVGKKNSFCELAIGARYFDGTEKKTSGWNGETRTNDLNEFVPAFTFGYRFQKPGGHFVFRSGVGYPEIYYVSIGVVF